METYLTLDSMLRIENDESVIDNLIRKGWIINSPPKTESDEIANWTTTGWSVTKISISVPDTITPAQLRTYLFRLGMLDSVSNALASIPGSAGIEARIAWEYATLYHRSHPLVSNLGYALGLTDSQIDDIFINASKL